MFTSPDQVLVTYREIAARFGLSGPHAARAKAKRAGWTGVKPNRPGESFRVRVPREIWGIVDIPCGAASKRDNGMQLGAAAGTSPNRDLQALEKTIRELRERLERECGRGDASCAISELMPELEAARARLTDLRLSDAMERAQAEARRAEAMRPKAASLAVLGGGVLGARSGVDSWMANQKPASTRA